MTIPKKVKIAGRTFDVVLQAPIETDLMKIKHTGRVFYETQKITLLDSMPQESKECILLHEIMHVIGDGNDLQLSEQTVQIIAINLYQVLKDNNLFNYTATTTEPEIENAKKKKRGEK